MDQKLERPPRVPPARPPWRRLIIAALCLLVPATAFFASLAVAALVAECTPGQLCLAGPGAAVILGSPGLATGAMCGLLWVRLSGSGSRGRRAAIWTGLALLGLAVAGYLGVLLGAFGG